MGPSVGVIVDRRGIARPDRVRAIIDPTPEKEGLESWTPVHLFGPNCDIPPIEISTSKEFQSPEQENCNAPKQQDSDSESYEVIKQNELQQENIALLNDLGSSHFF